MRATNPKLPDSAGTNTEAAFRRSRSIKRMKKIIVASIITGLVIILGAALILFLNDKQTEPEKRDQAQIVDSKEQSTDEVGATDSSEFDHIILEIPVIEYEGGNQLTEPIVNAYGHEVISIGEEFIIYPETLGYVAGTSVGAIKLRLVDVLADSIVVEVLADIQLDGNFHARDTMDTVTIKTGTCIGAFPLVLDVHYDYCFEFGEYESENGLRYRIEGESTLPSP